MSDWVPDSERIERLEERVRELSGVINDLGMTIYRVMESQKGAADCMNALLEKLLEEKGKLDARKTKSE
jgi:uncharacterized coiled-coil protein SlyX